MAPKPGSDQEHHSTLAKLESACADLNSLLRASEGEEDCKRKMEARFDVVERTLSTAPTRFTPLHSLSMSTKALDSRINRAISPALSLLHSFKIFESLQHTLLDISSQLSAEKTPHKRLKKVLEFVDCVDHLGDAIDSICEEGEPVIQRIQDVVDFISRTRTADQPRTQRLREALITLKALYETEVDTIKFEGLLDQALIRLQDEFETLLLQIRHKKLQNVEEDPDNKRCQTDTVGSDLGSELQVEVLRRISGTLADNDCADICLDIYIKVRYRRVAKALMKLNPEYLRTYNPEGIDEMESESLETAITLWIQHLKVAVRMIFFSERRLCGKVFGDVLDEVVWEECFARIADKIMAVIFRFGEGVARSSKEPHKLFKLLEMFKSLEKLRPKFLQIFEGEAGADIRTRFLELEKLIIDASSKAFWEFGILIEQNVDDSFPPPQDGSVPKLVRYAISYLKQLTAPNYRASMAKVLQAEQMWKARTSSQPENNEDLLKDAISNIMDALQRVIESKRSRFRDRILIHIFTMNACWYIYTRTKNAELGGIMGEQYMKTKFKTVAEEAAYAYQRQAWGVVVRVLDLEEEEEEGVEVEVETVEMGKDRVKGLATEKIETFLKRLDDTCRRHRGVYSMTDAELREQMREATVKLVVPAYAEFLESCSGVLQRKVYPSAQVLHGLVVKAFDGGDVKLKRRSSNLRIGRLSSSSSSLEA